MATVHEWTGLEDRVLRHALRLGVRGFAEHLGIAVNTVSKWEKLLERDSLAILDTALARADAATHLRIETYLSEPGRASAGSGRRITIPRSRAWEYEEGTDDLDRAVLALSRRKFHFAEDLLRRWTSRFNARRNRSRARLWVGTALSKDGNHDYAARVMHGAIREFEELPELDDWSVAYQKLALARRGAGDLDADLRLIGVACSTGTADLPMQRVRLDTAYGHILLSDPVTLDDGFHVLDDAHKLAAEFGLSHQLRSIEDIRKTSQGAPGPLRT